MYCSVGRHREWLKVYARSPHCPWRSERGTIFSQTKYLYTYIPLTYEGKHTGQ